MAFVLNEQDIFKFVVENEEDEVNSKRAIDCSKKIISRIPINIFEDTYYIMYNALEKTTKYNIQLTYDIYHQILSEQKSDLITDSNIRLFANDNLTEQERADRIVDLCLAEYDELCEFELQDTQYLNANMDFYIHTWCNEKSKEIAYNMATIMDEGLTVGRKFYKGFADADVYYRKAYEIVKDLTDANANQLSESIDTSKDSPDEIREKGQEEAESEEVSKSGIAELDDNYKFRRGEIIAIQAGTGVGKTKLANAFTYNSLRMNKNVLYLSLEQKASRIFPMIQARHILESGHDIPNLTDKEIIFKSYDYNYEPLVNEALNDLVMNPEVGKVKIDSLSVRAVELKDYLTRVWDEGFHFDVVVIDYFGLLECSDRYKDLTSAINMLKTECKSFKGQGFLGIIPNQLDKQSEKDLADGKLEGMTKTAGSETQFASRGADYVFTLEQPMALKRVNKMRFHVGKVRLGNIHKPSFIVNADLGRITFTSDDSDEDDFADEWED